MLFFLEALDPSRGRLGGRRPGARSGGAAAAAESVLAAFGICWYLATLATSVLATAQQAALVLGATPSGRRSVLRLYTLGATLSACAFVVVGRLPAAQRAVFVELHEVRDPRTLRTACAMLVLMAGFPFLEMAKRYNSGVLSAHKKTAWVTVGAMANVGGILVTVRLPTISAACRPLSSMQRARLGRRCC